TEKWTPLMVSEWKTRRGYDPTLYLPALAGIGGLGDSNPAVNYSDGSSARARFDYLQMWSDLYIDNRVKPLQAWAKSLGLQYRAQEYGQPIDSAEAALYTGVPEGEWLSENH